jgi:hypothetical protein
MSPDDELGDMKLRPSLLFLDAILVMRYEISLIWVQLQWVEESEQIFVYRLWLMTSMSYWLDWSFAWIQNQCLELHRASLGTSQEGAWKQRPYNDLGHRLWQARSGRMSWILTQVELQRLSDKTEFWTHGVLNEKTFFHIFCCSFLSYGVLETMSRCDNIDNLMNYQCSSLDDSGCHWKETRNDIDLGGKIRKNAISGPKTQWVTGL